MKRMSIKLKVTVWIALLTALIAAVAIAFILFFGENAALDSSKENLVDTVEDVISEIEYTDGELKYDDFLGYDEGAYISVYEDNGKFLYGEIPKGFSNTEEFIDNDARTVKDDGNTWFVFDTNQNIEGFGRIWIRGVSSNLGIDDTFRNMFVLALFVLPVLVFISSVGGYIIIRRAFGPVRRITKTAEEIGDSKDLSARIDLGEGRDEIYSLALTFDGMFERLQAAFENEKRFTSDVSHELRTPISVIIAQCEYALENAKTTEEAKQALGVVLSQTQNMSKLISQMLTLARTDNAHEKLKIESVDLSELVELVIEQQKEKVAEKNISIRSDIKQGLVIPGDHTMLMRMFINLIDNAIKYSGRDGEVRVELYSKGVDEDSDGGGNIVCRISDDGIGIAKDDLTKIWERFYQVDPARSSSAPGSGLGLPMVKWIAEAHGGKVSAQSAPGKGSVFIFTIPEQK